MKLVSSVFEEGKSIPKLYSCQGRDINPPLEIADVPEKAVSLALIMDDPDVPKSVREDGMWVHWLFWNLDPKTTFIDEQAKLSCLIGQNTGGENRYMGPCPPDREHRYFFKLYALDCQLKLKRGATKDELLSAMEGHIIADCQLMGRYEKH
jgi:Raf kinase inhibitor-like YbhB/YbcL family protein